MHTPPQIEDLERLVRENRKAFRRAKKLVKAMRKWLRRSGCPAVTPPFSRQRERSSESIYSA
jgi:hypothetical protein